VADDVRGDWLPLLGGVAYGHRAHPSFKQTRCLLSLSTKNSAPYKLQEAAGRSKSVLGLLTAYKLDRYLLWDNTLLKTFFQ